MHAWQELIELTDSELAACDIAQVNLACVQNLPKMKNVDLDACLRIVDSYADQIRGRLSELRSQFYYHPEVFENSWAFCRVMDMVTVLQRDFGAHYHQEIIEQDDPTFFRKADNLFIHGVVTGKGGTCSSLPPLYVAVGRRLGYPLKLVTAFKHLFARWDGEGERFNIECTSRGLVSHPDEHYQKWPRPLSDEEVKKFGSLQSLTPRRELATFLANRGHCCFENGQLRDAVISYAYATDFDPKSHSHSAALVNSMNCWDVQLRKRMMPGFPCMTIHFPPRHFKSIPKDLECGIFHMKTKENLLNDRRLQVLYWEPLRQRGRLPKARSLAHIEVSYPPNETNTVEVTFHKKLPRDFHKIPKQPC